MTDGSATVEAGVVIEDEATIPPKDQQPEGEKNTEKIGPRMQTEVRQTTSALFTRRIKEARANPNASLADKAVETSDQLGRLTSAQLSEKKDQIDNGLKEKPLFTVINGERVRVAEITGADADALKCRYIIDAGDGAPDTEDAASGVADIPRNQIMEANLLAEQEEILNGLQGDEKAVAEAYFQLIDPFNDETPEYSNALKTQVEKVAERNGMVTASVIKDAATSIYGAKVPDEVTTLLSSFDATGKTVLDRNDLQNALYALGVDRGKLDQQADSLLEQLSSANTQLEEAKKTGADTTLFQQRIDEIKNNLTLVTTTSRLWKEKEASDTSPLDTYLDGAVNGNLDPRFIQELGSGKLDSIFDTLYQDASKNLSEAEKAELKSNFDKLKSGSWKTLKFGGILLAILAAIPVAAAAGAVYVGANTAAGAQKR